MAKKTGRAKQELVTVKLLVCERDGSWWVASIPSFPGAYSQGKTKLAAYVNQLSAMRDLIAVYIDEARGGRPRHRRRRRRP